MFKLLGALALLAVAVASAHAQAGSAPAGGQACGAAGQAACAKVPERKQDVARPSAAGEPGGLALAWAALGVVAFLALRRQPRP